MSATSAIANPFTIYMRIIRHDKSEYPSLEKAFNKLIDLIKIRLQSQNIEAISNGLLEETFEIRLDIISWLAGNFDTIRSYIDTINSEISDINYQASHTELFHSLEKTLYVTNKITLEAYKEKEINDFEEIKNNIQANRPTYKSFHFLRTQPQTEYFVKWLDESLRLDIATITSILILTEEIQIDSKRIQQELIPFLNKTIERYGAYSIFIQFWNPNENDDTPETYKMQILADTIRMNNGIQPLYLENEEDLEDVALGLAMEAVSADKECVDVDELLKELRG